jgi:hypothetical protein
VIIRLLDYEMLGLYFSMSTELVAIDMKCSIHAILIN